MITARLKRADILTTQFSAPIRLAVSRVLLRETKQVATDLESIIKETFWFPDKPEKLRELFFKKTGQRVTRIELRYKYQVMPLGRYPTLQHRITYGRNMLEVKRGFPFTGHHKRGFERSIRTVISGMATYVQIRKAGGKKLVHGNMKTKGKPQNYMGWLHSGHKSSFSSGQKFAAAIFERKQKRTWKKGKRQPIQQLFGPSLTDLMKSKEIQGYLNSGKPWQTVQKIINEEFSRG